MSKKRDIPVFNKPIIETHCHLDYLKQGTISEILQKAKEKSVEMVMTISVTPDNLDSVLEIANNHENVFCTQGIHPHDARLWSDDVEKKIISNITNSKKVKAVGEIGLDFHYNHSAHDKQIEVFSRQLELAIEQNLPVVIHTRDADEETLKVLEKYQSQMKKKGVIHSFTSGLELAKQAIQWGFHLGFNGIITFKNAENVRDALRLTPMKQILLETDAPFLTPDPFRGRENAPHFLPLIVEKVSEVKNQTVDEVLVAAYQNSLDLFEFVQNS